MFNDGEEIMNILEGKVGGILLEENGGIVFLFLTLVCYFTTVSESLFRAAFF